MLLRDEVVSLLGWSPLLPPAPTLKRASEELGGSHLCHLRASAQQRVTFGVWMSGNISLER